MQDTVNPTVTPITVKYLTVTNKQKKKQKLEGTLVGL
jgi:hypothetical protein